MSGDEYMRLIDAGILASPIELIDACAGRDGHARGAAQATWPHPSAAAQRTHRGRVRRALPQRGPVAGRPSRCVAHEDRRSLRYEGWETSPRPLRAFAERGPLRLPRRE